MRLGGREHDYYVYMVTNEARTTLYIGMTNNLVRRVSEHREGKVKGFTERYRLNRLVYWEHYDQVEDAIAREKQLKRWSRVKKDGLIGARNPGWRDLAVEDWDCRGLGVAHNRPERSGGKEQSPPKNEAG